MTGKTRCQNLLKCAQDLTLLLILGSSLKVFLFNFLLASRENNTATIEVKVLQIPENYPYYQNLAKAPSCWQLCSVQSVRAGRLLEVNQEFVQEENSSIFC